MSPGSTTLPRMHPTGSVTLPSAENRSSGAEGTT